MCLAIPGKVISIDDSNPDLLMARVDFGGVIREVCIQWLGEEVKPGDYVITHTGMAISKLSEEEARATLQTFKEMREMLGDDFIFSPDEN